MEGHGSLELWDSQRDEQASSLILIIFWIRTLHMKKLYICTHGNCNEKYSRMPDLRLHYFGAHQVQIGARRCERAVRGFPKSDKRDIYEKKCMWTLVMGPCYDGSASTDDPRRHQEMNWDRIRYHSFTCYL